MTTIIVILYILTLTALLLVRGMRPERSHISRFELERRVRRGSSKAAAVLRRENLLHDVYSLQHVAAALLLVTVSALGVLLFHWALGFVVSLLIALEIGAVARLRPVNRVAHTIYTHFEPKILNLIERYPRVFRLLRTVAPLSRDQYILQSREELLEVVSQADTGVISEQEKRLIVHGLQFDSRRVKEIMAPRDQLDVIKKTEMLGPLVLDELHKTGHSRFPVIDKDLDHIVGILHIRNLLQLDQRRSVTAEKAMDQSVYYIRDDQTLAHALAAHLRTRHHLFIVIDKNQVTVGVLSLEDVIEALLGHEIQDEHEADSNRQAVADRAL